jgi:RNA polymerase sigma-70 factor (ECF subfamily)
VEIVNAIDSARLFKFLGQVQEPFRAALSLFYLEDYSYKEIADILEVPIGTVRSRISRGIAQLQQSILRVARASAKRAMPGSSATEPRTEKVREQPSPDGIDDSPVVSG